MSIQIKNEFVGSDSDWVLRYLEKHEPPEVADLLTLLCCLGGVDIPVRMLLRANAPRIVWGSDGEKEGIFEPCLKIGSLISAVSTGAPIETLSSYGLVVRKEPGCGDETLSVDPDFFKSAESLMACQTFWNNQAIIIVCHTFPRGRDLGVPYGIVGNQQLLVLKHVVKYFLDKKVAGTVSLHIKHLMAETLLAGSTFSDFDWKYTALTIAEDIILADPNPYLLSWARWRRSMLYRLDPSIRSFEMKEVAPGSLLERRTNALSMRQSLQTAQVAIEGNMLTHAHSILEGIKPLDSNYPSTMERIVLRDRDFAAGRVYRFQGRFEEALECFKLLSPSYVEANKSYYSLLYHQASTLIELGDAKQAENILFDAPCFNDIDDKYFRISLAEVKLHLKSFDAAEEICQGLKLSHDAIKKPDKNALNFNLRILTVLARAAHLEGRLEEALFHWQSCRYELDRLESTGWAKDGFMQMIYLFSVADIEQKTGHLVESRRHKVKAEAILEAKGRRHWITGLGTIWLDAIRTSIEVTGTELACRMPERWWTAQIDAL